MGGAGRATRRHPVQRLERADRPAAVVAPAGCARCSTGSGPTSSTRTSRSRPAPSMWATLEARAPVVATFHSGAARSRLFDLAAPVLRRVARRLAVRIAVSEAAAAFARDADRRLVRDRAQRGGRGPVRRTRSPADLGPGHEAAVRRAARRAQGVPDRGRGVRAARRRPARTCGSSSSGDGPGRDRRSTPCRPTSATASRSSGTCRTGPPADPRGLRPLPGSVGGRGELRDRAGGGDGGRACRWSRATSPATTRWCATGSTGCWSRRETRRRSPPQPARVLDDPRARRPPGRGGPRARRRPSTGASWSGGSRTLYLRAAEARTAVATIGPVAVWIVRRRARRPRRGAGAPVQPAGRAPQRA